MKINDFTIEQQFNHALSKDSLISDYILDYSFTLKEAIESATIVLEYFGNTTLSAWEFGKYIHETVNSSKFKQEWSHYYNRDGAVSEIDEE